MRCGVGTGLVLLFVACAGQPLPQHAGGSSLIEVPNHLGIAVIKCQSLSSDTSDETSDRLGPKARLEPVQRTHCVRVNATTLECTTTYLDDGKGRAPTVEQYSGVRNGSFVTLTTADESHRLVLDMRERRCRPAVTVGTEMKGTSVVTKQCSGAFAWGLEEIDNFVINCAGGHRL